MALVDEPGLNPRARTIFDGDPGTALVLSQSLPLDFVIDLGENLTIKGFTYLPYQGRGNPGTISGYEFYVSNINGSWGKPIVAGEFSNIENSPVLQQVTFNPVTGRFVKLRALSAVADQKRAGIAEFDVITQ